MSSLGGMTSVHHFWRWSGLKPCFNSELIGTQMHPVFSILTITLSVNYAIIHLFQNGQSSNSISSKVC